MEIFQSVILSAVLVCHFTKIAVPTHQFVDGRTVLFPHWVRMRHTGDKLWLLPVGMYYANYALMEEPPEGPGVVLHD